MRESLVKKQERALDIYKIFEDEYNSGECTLNYENALQLLIATQLAAQCTDARVNLVTPALFAKYPDACAFAHADELELREDIRSTGFYRNKAKNIISCCKRIVEVYNSEVPDNMDDLLTLAGVGRKTANLVLGDFFGIPGVVVDTHATRLANRMGFTSNSDPYKIELDLQKILPSELWASFCHCLVHHGRKYCTARSPKCDTCPVFHLCPKKLQKK